MNARQRISVVIPVFNEAAGLGILYDRLRSIADSLAYDVEMIFVNDGSRDHSGAVLLDLHRKDRRVKVVDLSRNFGHQNALSAGIELARGAAVVLMDADMEDDPAHIPAFVREWEQGAAVVYARRHRRQVSWLRNLCFDVFHKANRMMSRVPMDAAGTFSLMDRRVVDHLRRLTEKDKYIPGLRSWIGFKQVGIDVPRGARYDGRSRVGIRALVELAFDSFTSFSTAPLKLAMLLGVAFSLLSFIGIAVVIFLKVVLKVALLGWASTICVILLAAGVQLLCLWLQGEYLARVFNEVKGRPNYIISETVGFDA